MMSNIARENAGIERESDVRQEVVRARSELRLLVGQSERPSADSDWLVGSPSMIAIKRTIDRIAATDATVLVWGESGVGKEVVARALHRRSRRRERPFVKVNCAALPFELLESELFGYERGAFTGAHRQKPGKFELADSGTILLDEIGEMPLPLQAKLLQVLQDRQFSRLGSRQDVRVDAWVIALTNKDLGQAVARGAFREDLYYRVNVLSIHVPPLRDRREEIPILVAHYLGKHAKQYGRPGTTVSAETMQHFMDYSWPGNIRELENIVKRIVVLGADDWVGGELAGRQRQAVNPLTTVSGALPVSRPTMRFQPGPGTDGLGLKEIGRRAAREAERAALMEVLTQVRWHRTEAARRLKISYKALLYKIKQCAQQD